MFEDLEVASGQLMVSEAMAMARVRENDLERIIGEHAQLVFRIAYSVLRNHHDAEDATQETFLRVLRFRSKLAAVKDSKAWLARIAWRVAIGRKRKSPNKGKL